MRPEHAETYALDLLLWLAQAEERIGPVLAASGLEAGELRARARDPEALGFVLDGVLADEALLLEGCAACGLDPAQALAARAALPGGDAPFWT